MREYTKKEKFLNWLHYNKLWVAAVALVIWVTGSMLWNVLGIGQSQPDYCFAYVGSRELSAETVEILEKALASFGTDLNGDGQVVVSLTQHITADPTNTDNMMYGYAADMTVLADITEGESTFFLLEDPVSFQISFQILAHLDGSIPAEEDFEALDKVYLWKNCPALASLELGMYEDKYLDLTETGEIQDLLSGLYLGRRYFFDPSQQKNPDADDALWRAMTEGATR
jgi:hypothetical protein